MELVIKISELHASANPAQLFASVQEASAPDAIDDLAVLAAKHENAQPKWLTKKNTVLSEIREALAAMEQPQARGTTIAALLDKLDALIKEDCRFAEMLRRRFKRAEKTAKKTISRSAAKRIHELGRRFDALLMRQIEVFADVGDHLRALLHHYDVTAEKQPQIHITLENAATPAQLRALLVK